MSLEGWTSDLLIFLVTAGIVVPLFSRIRLGTVVGFLLAGVLLGPRGLGALAEDFEWLAYVTFADDERVAPFAELGILFLLFTVGLELSVGRLWAMRRIVLGVGIAQISLSTIFIAGPPGSMLAPLRPSLSGWGSPSRPQRSRCSC